MEIKEGRINKIRKQISSKNRSIYIAEVLAISTAAGVKSTKENNKWFI